MRKVRTASGATAVQIVSKSGGVRRIVEHLGSARDETELEVLLEAGRQKIAAGQGQGLLDLESLEPAPGRTNLARTMVESKHSRLLWEVLHGAYRCLGLGEAVGGDRAFEQMVLARLIEPTSKAQVPRVLGDLGLESVSVRTLFRSLARAQERGYRESLSNALFEHVTNTGGGLALCLYDVTTLYFEAEREDDLRKVGCSKERRVDPQVIVGLLVDRRGFRLRIGCWEGNKAETTTIIPIVEAFQAAHGIEELVIVADAGMLSAANLTALDEARLRFIVGARVVRAPTMKPTPASSINTATRNRLTHHIRIPKPKNLHRTQQPTFGILSVMSQGRPVVGTTTGLESSLMTNTSSLGNSRP